MCVEAHTPDKRFSRKQRLRDSRLFREAFDGGRSYPGRFLVLWLRSGEDASLRLGVVASKRTFRRAVDRARAKRLLREAFRLNRDRLDGAYDVVLVARRRILEVKCPAVERDLLVVAKRAGIAQKLRSPAA